MSAYIYMAATSPAVTAALQIALLKAAQVYRHKDLPDCYPNMGHEVVGNLRGNQFTLGKSLLPVARNPMWMLEGGSTVAL